MPTVIDSLQIEIQSGSADASRGIDALAASLEKLRSSSKTTVVVKNLQNLSAAVRGFSDASKASSAMSTLASAIERLKSVGSVASIVNNLSKLPTALKNIESVDTGKMESQFRGIAGAAGELAGIKSGGLSSMVNALSKIDKVTKDLDDTKIAAFAERVKLLNEKLGPLSEKMATIKTGFSTINSGASRAAASVQKFDHGIHTSTLNLSSFIDVLKNAAQALQGAVQRFTEFLSQAIEWDGIAARFGRGFGSQAQETYEWIQRLNEEMHINVQQFMQYSSLYAQMLTGFGVASKDATKMALGYTELTYDIWASANDRYKSFSDAAEAVASAIAGEVEPIRRAGFTIIESTLEQTAANHGLEISIANATEAQKSYLRYLTLVDQAHATGVIGTYAKELNTAEGLMRTFRQQLTSLTQAFGSLFLPVLVRVMPYVQAFVELLTEGVKAFAALFGIEIQGVDWSGYNAGVSDAVSGTEGVTDALGDAAKAAKELKNASIGIDELNVISPSSAAGNGTGGVGGAGGSAWDDLDIDSMWDESIFKDINDQVDAIKEKIKGWLPVIEAVGLAIGALSLASFLQSIGDSIHEMNKLNKILSTVGIVTLEAILVFAFADNYLESGNLLSLVGEALATAASGYLLFKAWGAKGAVLALGVSIAAQLAAITLNLADGGVDISDPELWIQSAFTTALAGVAGGWMASKGLIKMSKGKGLGIGVLAGISLTLASITIGEITANGELTKASILTGLGSIAAAAGFGFTIGGAWGAVIGAGVALAVNVVGAVIGEITANSKKNIEEELKSRFGEIELSGEELSVYIDKVTAIPRKIILDTKKWNEELGKHETETSTVSVGVALDIFATESATLDKIKETIESTQKQIDRNNLKIVLGMEVGQSDYTASIDAFVSNAQGYLDQYYLTTRIALGILDGNDGLDGTLTSFYSTSSEKLSELGAKLKQTISDAFVDGEWIPDKLNEAIELQNEMQQILDYIADVEFRANIQNLKLSVTGDALSPESFSNVLTGATEAIEERLATLEEVKMSKLQVAVMEYDANIEAGKSEEEAKKIYNQTVADIEREYQNGRVEVTYGTVDFGLSTLKEAFGSEISRAKSEKWFDFGTNLETAMNVPGAIDYVWDNGKGDIYAGLGTLAWEIRDQIKTSLHSVSDETKDSLGQLLETLKPTMADYESIAKSSREAGDTVTEEIRNGLNDYNQLKALSGDTAAINYLIGQGFSTDPTFLNTLATVKGAGKAIDSEVAEGLLNNLDYVTDEASGVVVGIKDSITGKTIELTPELVDNMKTLGVDLSEGLATGVEENEPSLWTKISTGFTNLVDKIKNFFGINSPSKLMRDEVGKHLSSGIAEGMDTDGIENPLSTMWDTAKTWWDKKPSLSTYTPTIGSIKDKLSSAWTSAKDWWNEKKPKLKEYTPSIGSIYDKLKPRWDNAREWWNEKKTKMKEYTPSIGSIYEKAKERWDNARTWWNSKKTAFKTYTPSIGSILDKVKSAWNTAKSWWNKNVGGLTTKLNIKVPKISVKWATASAFGKEFRYPTGFNLVFAANGGIFDAGSLIWAGERGAEIVANAGGGKTGVMNVDQMQEAVYEGVLAAMTAVMGNRGGDGTQSVNVYLDSRQITSSVERRQHEKGASILGNEVFA